MIAKYSFSKAYDLQNSARTSFYKKYIFEISDWSSSKTARGKGMKKNDLTHESVLERFKLQLDNSNIITKYSLTPDFSWAVFDVNKIINKYLTRKFILIFPLSSPKLIHKQWPYYNDLIKLINSRHTNIEIVVAPGPNEIEQAKNINAISITNNNKALNIMELAGLIKKASFIIANDTGPAHMAAHLGASGIVLFGYHTTPKKVSIETDKFKAISVNDLNNLTVEKVYSEIKEKIELIN
jgi:ADP-heptose:LPS heptosyltransferase